MKYENNHSQNVNEYIGLYFAFFETKEANEGERNVQVNILLFELV